MRKSQSAPTRDTTNCLESLMGEIAEGVEIVRPIWPEDSEDDLHSRAESLRGERYLKGRWPTVDELIEKRREETETEQLQEYAQCQNQSRA
jgi:hypothetical protein